MLEKPFSLLNLARIRFPNLTPAEVRLCQAIEAGKVADFSWDEASQDLDNAAPWGPQQTITAPLVAWLAISAQDRITNKGICIINAFIQGRIDLSCATLPYPLALLHCICLNGMDLHSAKLCELILTGTHCGPILATGLKTEGSIYLNNGFASNGELNLTGSEIGGAFICTKGRFENPSWTSIEATCINVKESVLLDNGFIAFGRINLTAATIGNNFDCTGAKFEVTEGKALNANGITVKRNVELRLGFHSFGEISFCDATIGGTFSGRKSTFIAAIKKTGKTADRFSLKIWRTKIAGSVYLNSGFVAKGVVSFLGTAIGSNLECANGKFIYAKGKVFDARRLSVKGSVYLSQKFYAKGEIDFCNATISSNLFCTSGHMVATKQNAFLATSIHVSGNVFFRNGLCVEGIVCLAAASIGNVFEWSHITTPQKASLILENATIGILLDDKASWPNYNKLVIHGLVYQSLSSECTATVHDRLTWLKKQRNFSLQPYEQLAAYYRHIGHEHDARVVLIAKNEAVQQQHLKRPPLHGVHPKTNLERYQACFHHFLGLTVQYGYNPWRAVQISAFTVLLGMIVFFFAYNHGLMTATQQWPVDPAHRLWNQTYPAFNPLLYSLEAFLPIIDLGVEHYWTPNASQGSLAYLGGFYILSWGGLVRLYLWLHILAGWVLTTLFAAAVGGYIKR